MGKTEIPIFPCDHIAWVLQFCYPCFVIDSRLFAWLQQQRRTTVKPRAGAAAPVSTPVQAPKVSAAPATPAQKNAGSGKKKGLSNNEQKELSGLPDAIEKTELRVAELGQTLADPKTYAAGGKEIARVTAELERAKAEVDKLTARWEELELKRAE